jgi:hypothetical protein
LLGFDSSLQQYTDGSALGVLLRSASCDCPGRASGRGRKSGILKNVTFALDTEPPPPAPSQQQTHRRTHRTAQDNIAANRCIRTAGHAETSSRATSRASMHAANISTLRGPIGCICARSHALNSEPSIAAASCTSAEQAQIEPVRDGVARRGAGLAGRARWAVEGGDTSQAEAGQLRPQLIDLAPSCAWNQHLRHECTNCHCRCGGCECAAVRYFHAQTLCGGKYSPPVA